MKDEAGESALMSNQSHWEGRLKAVKREIITVKRDITKNQAEMKAEMGAMNAKISGLESKIDQLLEAIMKKK